MSSGPAPRQYRTVSTSSRCPMTPSVSRKPCASSTSEPGVRIVTVTAVPLTRISSGSSTTRVSGRVDRVVGGQVAGTPARGDPAHRSRLQADHDRLGHRRVRPGRGVVQRHQRVGLGVVGRGVADRGRVRHHQEVLGAPLLQFAVAVGELGDQVDAGAVGQSERLDVGGVDEHHPAAALDAAVAVVEAVDRGVVLVVAAQGLQHQPALRHRHPLQRVDREVGFPCGGGEFAGIPRRVGELEAVGLPDLGVVVGAAGHHVGDGVADAGRSRR